MIQEQKWKGFKRILYVPKCNSASVQLDIPDADSPTKASIQADAFIYALWVDKKNRQQHIGRQMLKRIEAIAKNKGCKSVSLEWEQGEAPEWVLEWYLRCGYECVDSCYYDKILLRKELK